MEIFEIGFAVKITPARERTPEFQIFRYHDITVCERALNKRPNSSFGGMRPNKIKIANYIQYDVTIFGWISLKLGSQ